MCREIDDPLKMSWSWENIKYFGRHREKGVLSIIFYTEDFLRHKPKQVF